ncbi:MAG: 3-dehydroquinate synthase [Verrucomicrobia bacterium]|nr:3-dehydroquinate synthase [Verrucomicrobiota bacterium]
MVACFVNIERTSERSVFLFRGHKNQYRLAVNAVEVKVAKHSYRALIGGGLLASAGNAIKDVLSPARCALISDTNVASRFGNQLLEKLTPAGYEATPITVSPGEQSKTLEQVGQICDQMLASGLDRESFVVGLGGGVIGDLGGFAAAVFQRGIPHVQIPTTLLAMVDSSVGGKTGVNARAGKNLIGSFHPPALVIDDIDVLKTLPHRDLNQGFAEIIKHAVIADAEMFQQLEDIDLGPSRTGTIEFAPLVRRNIEIKARVIADDESDRKGERALLNFGHTIGHAIERAANYHDIAHGEAVSLGMVAACGLSKKMAGLPDKDRDRVIDLLQKFQLPTQLPNDFQRDKIFDAIKFDKKFSRGEVRFVVTPKIGSARLSSDVTMDDLRAAIYSL